MNIALRIIIESAQIALTRRFEGKSKGMIMKSFKEVAVVLTLALAVLASASIPGASADDSKPKIESERRTDRPNCKKGKPCGLSCIPQYKQCHK